MEFNELIEQMVAVEESAPPNPNIIRLQKKDGKLVVKQPGTVGTKTDGAVVTKTDGAVTRRT